MFKCFVLLRDACLFLHFLVIFSFMFQPPKSSGGSALLHQVP